MQPAYRDAVITGLGAVCAVAENQHELWDAIQTGRDGIEPIRRFAVDGFRTSLGAIVKTFADPDASGAAAPRDLCRHFAERAAGEAITDARLASACFLPDRVGFVFGTGLGDVDGGIHELAALLASHVGARGVCVTVSNACSSSTCAMGIARDLLAMGAADAVIAGGADVLSAEVFAGFHALGVLSTAKCAPFSLPLGTTLGEGAGFVVLERRGSALSRGVRIHAALTGYGLSGDAYHETSPDPTGSGVERAVRDALDDARLPATSIGYVNAHGSGTQANDPAEWRGIHRSMGLHLRELPVSSTKGALGHAQGAAGVLEAIVTVLAMNRGVVPPTLHFKGPRPHVPDDPVGDALPRARVYDHALCLNSAFGGANAAAVLSRRHRDVEPAPRHVVSVRGVGGVGPEGLGVDACSAPSQGPARNGGRVPPFSIEALVPTADPRGLDPASRYLTAAAALALADAGLVIRGAVRDRAGLFVGAVRPSPTSMGQFRASIAERGLLGLSAPAFARIVLNAPAGICSKLLSLRGPLATLTTGPASGLAAIVLAAEFLSTHREVDWMLAGGVDEAAPAASHRDPAREGAAMLLLGREVESSGASGAHPVVVAGWGLAGAGRLANAVARARDGAAEQVGGGERVFDEQDWGGPAPGRAEAVASARACVAAVLALRRREIERALVVSQPGASTTAALLLTR